MNKGLKIIVAGFVLLVLASLVVWNVVLTKSPLRASGAALKRNLLNQTPLGSSMDEVRSYVRHMGYEMHESQTAGIYEQDGTVNRFVGQKSIWVFPGDYVPMPFKILGKFSVYYFRTYVEFEWAFDENGRLIEIWVRKDSASM